MNSELQTKPSKIGVVTVAYNLPGGTKCVVESACRGTTLGLQFIVFSHSGLEEKKAELADLSSRDDVQLRDYGFNRGLAKSWNEGILACYYEDDCDVAIVVNEDIEFAEGDLQALATAALDQRDCHIVTGRAFEESWNRWDSSEYGCFAINPAAINTLGCFDENFFPIFCEDSDYRYRAKLAGLRSGYCPTTQIRHGGSRSLEQPEVARQNTLTYARNRDYFAAKWGGDCGQETFQRPFDDERFTYYIDPRNREAPYLGFNRTDHDIVSI